MNNKVKCVQCRNIDVPLNAEMFRCKPCLDNIMHKYNTKASFPPVKKRIFSEIKQNKIKKKQEPKNLIFGSSCIKFRTKGNSAQDQVLCL